MSKEERDTTQEQLTSTLSPNAIVNPSVPQIRVEVYEGARKFQDNPSLGAIKGSHDEVNIIGGSAVEASAKKKANRTVNPSGTIQLLTKVGGDSVNFSGGDQEMDVQVGVIDNIVRSPHQTVAGKVSKGNGIVTSAFPAIVNPSLGDVYDLQFKASQEVWG